MAQAGLKHDERWREVAAEADRCVRCGLCLPHCPTYRVNRKESESPRGRISLIQAIAQGELQDWQSALEPLQHCLGCMNCQQVCPADVRYGFLLAKSRQLLPQSSLRGARRLRWLMTRNWVIRLGASAHRLWTRLGAPRRWLPAVLRQWAAGFAESSPVASHAESATNAQRWLFSGCASAIIDQPAREAAAQLLMALGVSVRAHPFTGCCGQLHRIAGDASESERLSAALRQRLQQASVTELISVGSGCHSQLGRVSQGVRVVDLGQLLLEHQLNQKLRFRPSELRVALHLPCTQRTEVRDSDSWARLLAAIPGLSLRVLRDGPTCCGAAGTHMLEQPATALALREESLDLLQTAPVDLLLTTNPGCALYLRAGLAQRGEMRVAHPVELLAEQLLLDPKAPPKCELLR